jgi:hypothetical protein
MTPLKSMLLIVVSRLVILLADLRQSAVTVFFARDFGEVESLAALEFRAVELVVCGGAKVVADCVEGFGYFAAVAYVAAPGAGTGVCSSYSFAELGGCAGVGGCYFAGFCAGCAVGEVAAVGHAGVCWLCGGCDGVGGGGYA